MSEKSPLIRYDHLIDRALRSVVREALIGVAKDGLPGEHHFYITFQTTAPGVELVDWLQAKYPDTMTIVLQHEFWGLEVEAEHFAVTLSFSGQSVRLKIPYAALTAFADPAVRFGLQFQGVPGESAGSPEAQAEVAAQAAPAADAPKDEAAPKGQAEGEKVVALDRFRKK